MKKAIGLGAGGHAKVVLDILRQMGGYHIAGLLDADPLLKGKKILGVPVLGPDSEIAGLRKSGVRYAFVGAGAGGRPGDIAARKKLFELIHRSGLKPLSAVHPSAVIALSVRMGLGVTVMAGAIINPEARIGDNVIINTGAVVEHDCLVENHGHIATGAHLAGSVKILEGAHIGIGATVRQGVEIGKGAVVGAGSVVIRNVESGDVVVGVPAASLKMKPV